MSDAILRGLDPSRDAEYQEDREQHRRNLGRAIEYAQTHFGTGGGSGASLWDYAEITRAAVSAGAFRALDVEHLERIITSGLLGPNIGRNEHAVYVDRTRGRAIKLTKEGEFGARAICLGICAVWKPVTAIWTMTFGLKA